MANDSEEGCGQYKVWKQILTMPYSSCCKKEGQKVDLLTLKEGCKCFRIKITGLSPKTESFSNMHENLKVFYVLK